ncbi:MAG: oxidoreductase [Chloroflexi bacterium]|nr:oxidoreductase [Chloroflexota bacterium]
MKTAQECKLFGAYQALAGIEDAVVLLHSVVGCNFGTLSFHVPNRMQDIRQACTVISDNEIINGGEKSLKLALDSMLELYKPTAIFVISGCVSEMIGDDIQAVIEPYSQDQCIIRYVESAGFRGDFCDGYEHALLSLADLMEPYKVSAKPVINILGVSTDDYRAAADKKELQKLLGDQAELGTVFSQCTLDEVRKAPCAGLNLVLGHGIDLAREMKYRFGIPYELIDYPFGIEGLKEICEIFDRRFNINFSEDLARIKNEISLGLEPIYTYLQACYGMPAAVIGRDARAKGLRRFLEKELGMEVVRFARREEVGDLEEFYMTVRNSEVAVLFGSSFEQDLADELKIPLVRFDYPIFDEVCITGRSFIGTSGVLCLIEDILNAVMRNRVLKGALY